jgi:hypothetical protein
MLTDLSRYLQEIFIKKTVKKRVFVNKIKALLGSDKKIQLVYK